MVKNRNIQIRWDICIWSVIYNFGRLFQTISNEDEVSEIFFYCRMSLICIFEKEIQFIFFLVGVIGSFNLMKFFLLKTWFSCYCWKRNAWRKLELRDRDWIPVVFLYKYHGTIKSHSFSLSLFRSESDIYDFKEEMDVGCGYWLPGFRVLIDFLCSLQSRCQWCCRRLSWDLKSSTAPSPQDRIVSRALLSVHSKWEIF